MVLSTNANISILIGKASHYSDLKSFKKFWDSSNTSQVIDRVNHNIHTLLGMVGFIVVIMVIAIVCDLIFNYLKSNKKKLIALYIYKRELIYRNEKGDRKMNKGDKITLSQFEGTWIYKGENQEYDGKLLYKIYSESATNIRSVIIDENNEFIAESFLLAEKILAQNTKAN